MPVASGRGKRSVVVTCAVAVFFVFLLVTHLGSQATTLAVPAPDRTLGGLDLHDTDLMGHSIMPKLGNETIKAELGRAAWKLLHTTMARFPDEPTKDESAALKAYVHLFQRLYPCGECSAHFRKIIDKFPPQVSSRSAAAAWACHVHNEVNKSLKKDIFDCSNIGDFYDCGCAEEEKAGGMAATDKKGLADSSRDAEEQVSLPKLQKEGYGRGG